MDTIIQLLRRYAPIITVALLMLLVVVAGLFAYNVMHTKKLQEPVLLNQAIVKNPHKLGEALNVTPKTAKEVIAYRETTQPVITYYTQAPTLHDAAVVTKNAIKDKSPNIPPEAIEKSDRTAVVENTDEQILINTNKCYTASVHTQFLRRRKEHNVRGSVLARHLIQLFLPDEATPPKWLTK